MTLRIKQAYKEERYESPDIVTFDIQHEVVILDWLYEKLRAEIPLNEIEYILVI